MRTQSKVVNNLLITEKLKNKLKRIMHNMLNIIKNMNNNNLIEEMVNKLTTKLLKNIEEDNENLISKNKDISQIQEETLGILFTNINESRKQKILILNLISKIITVTNSCSRRHNLIMPNL